jgi:hypothetical protein
MHRRSRPPGRQQSNPFRGVKARRGRTFESPVSRRSAGRIVLLLLAVSALFGPRTAATAQECLTGPAMDYGWGYVVHQPDVTRLHQPEPSRTAGHLTTWAINAALGGLTAGIARGVQREPVLRGFFDGAIGGTVTYGGKWISGQEWCGAGFVGREIAALGASMVANAAEGRAPLERIFLPIGPVHLHIDRSEPVSVRAKLDVLGTLATTYALVHPDMQLRWTSTISAGTAVFEDRSPDEVDWYGRMLGGVITIRRERGSGPWRRTLSHEQVHVAQHDFSAHVWGEPLERWILGRVPGGEWVHRHFDLGLDFLIWGGAHLMMSNARRAPWEREAYFLSRSRSDF